MSEYEVYRKADGTLSVRKIKCLSRVKEYQKEYQKTHAEQIKENHKKWYEKNKEKQKAKALKWYYEHRERALATSKAYHRTHKLDINEYHRNYTKREVLKDADK